MQDNPKTKRYRLRMFLSLLPSIAVIIAVAVVGVAWAIAETTHSGHLSYDYYDGYYYFRCGCFNALYILNIFIVPIYFPLALAMIFYTVYFALKRKDPDRQLPNLRKVAFITNLIAVILGAGVMIGGAMFFAIPLLIIWPLHSGLFLWFAIENRNKKQIDAMVQENIQD